MANPFGTTFESLENPTGPVVESVHEAPYRRLTELIDSGDGQLISLRAPRAGYGKTMLLSRFREKKKGKMTIVPIHLADGRRVEGEGILEELLTQLTEGVPGSAGLTRLDLHARRLFAHGLLPLVYSGEVPSQDKDGALDSLRERPVEAFDFHHEGAAIAQWTKSQFEVLSPRLASVLSKSSGASGRDASFWIGLFFDYATKTPNEPSRTGDLMDAVFGRESRFRSGAGYLDGLGSFLNLITLIEPVVLILDEVDGLSSNSDSALRAASCLISLWESAPRTSVVVSVNDDVWESAFAPGLPLGLRDRLEDIVIRLEPLSKDEARSLVAIRSGDDADKILKHLDLESGDLYPRGVLRAARDAWEVREDEDSEEGVEEEGATIGMETVEVPESTETEEFAISGSGQVADEEPEVWGFEAAPPARPEIVYPPGPVRRVGMPRKFHVQRIRMASPVLEPAAPAAAYQPETPQPMASPFQVSSQPVFPPQEQAAPAPDRPVQMTQSPFETSPPPAHAPEMAPVDPQSFVEPESEPRRNLRTYPSNSPFEPAKPVSPEAPPVQPGQVAPPTQAFVTPPPFPENPHAQQPPVQEQDSPFQQPQVQANPFQTGQMKPPAQNELPKADADAIDELLRQFREHREDS